MKIENVVSFISVEKNFGIDNYLQTPGKPLEVFSFMKLNLIPFINSV